MGFGAVRAAIPVAGAVMSRAQGNSASGASGFRFAGDERTPSHRAVPSRRTVSPRTTFSQEVGAGSPVTSWVALVGRGGHGRPTNKQ
jgi:hypothetical protein